MPPGFKFVVLQDAAHRLGRDTLHEALAFQLPRQFQAIPLGEGTAQSIRSLAGQLDQMHRHRGGKTLAGAPARADRTALPCAG